MEYYASIFVNIGESFKFPRPYVNMDAIKVEKITSPSTLIWLCGRDSLNFQHSNLELYKFGSNLKS